MKKLLGLTLSLVLAMALGTMSFAAAQDPSKSPKTTTSGKSAGDKMAGKKSTARKTHQLTGVVSSVTASEITIKPTRGDAQTFTHDATTKKYEGLKEGEKVVLMYKEDGDKKMATHIKAAKTSGKTTDKMGGAKKGKTDKM